MDLSTEVKERTKEFKTDSYPMSIGEIINMYQNEEIEINPDFQRYYRWEIEQKSKLIESILLGIPIPPIFVYQRKDGVWEVVDGLQRISTVLEFRGVLKKNDELRPPLKLEKTKMLTKLDDVIWDTLEDELKLFFKRAKLKFEIIQHSSDPDAKFEVFERLNTGGSFLSYQEVRNCMLIMSNKDMFRWLADLAENSDFQECISLSDRLIDEQYDKELVLRYISCMHFSLEKMDVNEYLTESLKKIADDKDFDFEGEKTKFNSLFIILKKALGEQVFKRYGDGAFKGKFLESAFEAITVGVASNMGDYDEAVTSDVEMLRKKIEGMWGEQTFRDYSGSGSNARSRIPKMIEFGKGYFKK